MRMDGTRSKGNNYVTVEEIAIMHLEGLKV